MTRPVVLFDAVETAAVAAIGVLPTVATPPWWLLALLGAVFLGSKAMRYVATSSQDRLMRRHAIEAQLRLVTSFLANPTNKEIRATFHERRGRRRYKQILDYVPSGKGAGRTWRLDKGIVGRAIHFKERQVESFENAEEYRRKMIKKYRYTADEVMRRSIDRRSYCAWPIVNTQMDVLGVIYLDSPHPGVFTKPGNPHVLATLERACREMMNYLR